MPSAKMMNESFFNELMKKLNVAGELIKERQEEKQGALDDFTEQARRFIAGKISEKAMDQSVAKTNKELQRLDRDIKLYISESKTLSERIRVLTSHQVPKAYKATRKGALLHSGKRRHAKTPAKKSSRKKK